MPESIGNAFLNVIPKLDGDASSIGDGWGKKFSTGAKGSIGAGAVMLGNILTDAVRSVGSTIGDTLQSAFSNYSNYEQLAGGVEKIFDQANISGILNDAQNAYKELNLSANQYLESINQVGASFAQTMGDQKGYDVARQGMKAISDYASGTGRNLDELNEKFAMITRATSSYQSIADQFSGILPATSADFLAQAQAAGLLSTEYTKLTDVPIAEYQQAVSAMLEQGVRDMGLWDNTFNESTGTISGSLAMLSASWQNFLTELGKDSGDMPTRTQELVDSVIAVVENVAPRLLVFAENLFAAIPELYEKLKPYIDQFMAMASAFIEEHRPEIEAAATQLFDGITDALTVIIQTVIQKLLEAIGQIIATFPEWFPQLLAAAGELFLAIVEGLAVGMMPFFAELEKNMDAGLETIGGFFMGFFKAGGEIIDNIVGGISGALGQVQRIFDDVVYAMTHPLETAQGIIQGIIDTISSIFSGLHLELPQIALPHFNVWGGEFPYGIGGMGSAPTFDIQWYGKGGFANEPTLAGYGERGPELYWPAYDPYFDKYAKGIAKHMPKGTGGVDIHDCTFNVRQESDIRRVAQELNILINRQSVGAFA